MRSVLLFLSAGLTLFAEIIETPHFRDLEGHVSSDSLVILDIDDTLLIPTQTLGCDVWFVHQLMLNELDGKSADPLDKTLALWEAIRHLTQIQIVEPDSERLVEKMQKEGISVMGLTTQGLALATRTVNQLLSLDIDLSRTAPSKEDCYFLNEHGVLFRRGILFTSGTDKGEALLKFLDLANYRPKKVVFINDKRKHLEQVEQALQKKGIPFTGLRYSYSDQRIANYRPEIAEIQLRYSSLERILSDAEADRILSESIEEITNSSE